MKLTNKEISKIAQGSQMFNWFITAPIMAKEIRKLRKEVKELRKLQSGVDTLAEKCDKM